jgi:DNA-binding GntR family transcriptional regulator
MNKRAPNSIAGGRSAEPLGRRHQPLNRIVADAIRERILAGDYEPGERLAEERLSEELGISRMPVREALRALAAEGLVTLEARRGASVTAYSEAQAQELIEVRATLEALNAKLAARRRDPAQIAVLRGILEDGARITEKTHLARIQDANARFHEALGALGANSVLQTIVRSLRDRTAIIFAKQSRQRVRANWAEHAGILRAVVAGDAELAGDLASRHVFNAASMPEAKEAGAQTAQRKSASTPRPIAAATATRSTPATPRRAAKTSD